MTLKSLAYAESAKAKAAATKREIDSRRKKRSTHNLDSANSAVPQKFPNMKTTLAERATPKP